MTKELSGNLHDTHAVNLPEQSGTPSTPSSARWKSYFTSAGQYFLDDAGTASYVFNDHYHLYPASDGFYYFGSAAFRAAGFYGFFANLSYDDSATNTVTNVLTLSHRSSGTPAASFGTGIQIWGETTTTADVDMARIRAIWDTATHASRKGSLILSVFDTAERDALTITTDGTVPSIALAKSSISVATASYVPFSLTSSDNSTTNPLIRGLDSSAVVRWQVDYEGTMRLGRTSGGTHNGNILLSMHDQFPSFGFRSGTTERGKLIADVSANSFILETGQLDVRANGGNPIARFGTSSAALSVGTNATSGDTALWANLENATTNATDNVFTVSHNSSGTPAASFGGAMVMKLESSTTTFTLAARMRWQWITATHASRAARGILSAYDTAERDCFMWEASGSAAMIGFLGTTPTARQTGYTTFTNLTTDRTCDADTVLVAELADIVGTLIEDLKTKGLIAA